MFIVGIDVGNYDTKSQHTSTPTGYDGPFTAKPPITGEYICVNGEYYTPSNERFNYEKDKTKSDRCFILSLFAIAKEIHYYVSMTRDNLTHDETQMLISGVKEIGIGAGLPPTHFTEKRTKELIEYYRSKMKDGLSFEWNDYKYNVRLVACDIYPQGGAGAIDKENTFRKTYPQYYVVDIGGYTVDVLKYSDNKLDGKWQTKEEGIITMFDDISTKVAVNYDMTLDMQSLENILKGQNTIIADEVVSFVKEMTKQHADAIIDLVRQLGLEFKAFPVVFLGGGALLLEKYIRQNALVNEKSVLFISDPCCNANGYAKFLKRKIEKRH